MAGFHIGIDSTEYRSGGLVNDVAYMMQNQGPNPVYVVNSVSVYPNISDLPSVSDRGIEVKAGGSLPIIQEVGKLYRFSCAPEGLATLYFLD